MLKIIDKTNIYLTRGDSAYITLSVTDGFKNPLELSPSDIIRLQVRDKPNIGNLLFQGEIIREVRQGDDKETVTWHKIQYLRNEADAVFEDRSLEVRALEAKEDKQLSIF